MALTDEQLELLGNRLVPLYQELEQDVIADIARRVKKTGRYTETAELMARALMEQGYSPARIQREVMKVLRADKEYQMAVAEHTKEYKQYVASEISRVVAEAKERGNDIVADAGNMAFNADLSMWEQAGKSLSQPSGFHQLVDAMAVQTNGELKNLTKSLGFKNVGFTALENVYQHQLDLGLIKLTSGAYNWQRVVDDCVRELAQSGLRTIDYKSGRSMQLDTAVRNCIRTASGQLAGKVTMLNMDSTGESLVEVSQHWGARSDGSCGHGDHAYWQGKVYATDHGRHVAEARRLGYSIRNLEDATGYPSDPLGLCGYNCRHSFYVFFEGISEPNQWNPEPAPVTVNGRDYDYYHATQRQRQMERQIRATKREIEAQRALGGDAKELQSKLRKQTADYKRFSSDVDIRPKTERLRVQTGSSDLSKTKTMKWISDQYNGYTATIPKSWNKTVKDADAALKGANPKYVKIPRLYDKNEVLYHTNCVNSTIAYEMRCRGYNVIAGKANSKLRNDPLIAWENAEKIEVKDDIVAEVTEKMKEWGENARICVCEKDRETGDGHAFSAYFKDQKVEFVDPQTGMMYNINGLDIKNKEVIYFRTDNAIISSRGVNACEKE